MERIHHPAATSPSSARQPTLHNFFTEQQIGFDETHRAEIESLVQDYITVAETNHLPNHPLRAHITMVELRAAQRRLNSASCHGKDKVPNAALKVDTHELQILLLALLNAILYLCEYQAIWRHVLLAPLLKGGKRNHTES